MPDELSVFYAGLPPLAVRKNRGSTGWWNRARVTKRMRADYEMLWRDAVTVLDTVSRLRDLGQSSISLGHRYRWRSWRGSQAERWTLTA